MNIKVKCFTNLDEYKFTKWPDYLPVKPQVGEYIGSSSGNKLKIITITHYQEYLVIELHK